jgi:indole-3-glycerol phosphate synthase
VTQGILGRILEHKREEVRALTEKRVEELAVAALRAPSPRSLIDALRRGPGDPVRVLAEIKRASPSAGPIRPGADPVAIARDYVANGAAALSVLTDREFFDGDLAFVPAVRAVIGVPILRKDFLISEAQVLESRAAGADAILVIAAAVPDPMASADIHALVTAARAGGMDALVEVHDEAELERALAAGARLIGVNHRDLTTFAMDLGLTARLAPRLPADAVLVAESGIKTYDDVQRMGDAGAHAVLVGESLMRAPSPGAALAQLRGRA